MLGDIVLFIFCPWHNSMVHKKAFPFFLSVAPNLIGGFNPFEQIWVKNGNLPQFSGWTLYTKQEMKPPPSNARNKERNKTKPVSQATCPKRPCRLVSKYLKAWQFGGLSAGISSTQKGQNATRAGRGYVSFRECDFQAVCCCCGCGCGCGCCCGCGCGCGCCCCCCCYCCCRNWIVMHQQ